jgi:hypothetical protein
MKIYDLRGNTLGFGYAAVDFDNNIIPPKGRRIVMLQVGMEAEPCLVAENDLRYTYVCKDGAEAVDLDKVVWNDGALEMAGVQTKKNKEKQNGVR